MFNPFFSGLDGKFYVSRPATNVFVYGPPMTAEQRAQVNHFYMALLREVMSSSDSYGYRHLRKQIPDGIVDIVINAGQCVIKVFTGGASLPVETFAEDVYEITVLYSVWTELRGEWFRRGLGGQRGGSFEHYPQHDTPVEWLVLFSIYVGVTSLSLLGTAVVDVSARRPLTNLLYGVAPDPLDAPEGDERWPGNGAFQAYHVGTTGFPASALMSLYYAQNSGSRSESEGPRVVDEVFTRWKKTIIYRDAERTTIKLVKTSPVTSGMEEKQAKILSTWTSYSQSSSIRTIEYMEFQGEWAVMSDTEVDGPSSGGGFSVTIPPNGFGGRIVAVDLGNKRIYLYTPGSGSSDPSDSSDFSDVTSKVAYIEDYAYSHALANTSLVPYYEGGFGGGPIMETDYTWCGWHAYTLLQPSLYTTDENWQYFVVARKWPKYAGVCHYYELNGYRRDNGVFPSNYKETTSFRAPIEYSVLKAERNAFVKVADGVFNGEIQVCGYLTLPLKRDSFEAQAIYYSLCRIAGYGKKLFWAKDGGVVITTFRGEQVAKFDLDRLYAKTVGPNIVEMFGSPASPTRPYNRMRLNMYNEYLAYRSYLNLRVIKRPQ